MEKSGANHPFGLVLIAAFYMFGAVDLLVLLFANPTQTSSIIAQAHGLPPSTGSWILPLIAGLALLIAYGLVSLSRWGFVLTIVYLGYLVSINGWMLRTHPSSIYYGNLVWSLTVIVYLLLVRRCFYSRERVSA